MDALTFHHIGCLVASLEKSYQSLGMLSVPAGDADILYIASQDIHVQFQQLPGILVELIQPGPRAKGLRQMLDNGQGFYHIAFTCPDVDSVTNSLRQTGYTMVSAFRSEAFENKLCVFMRSPTHELIEFIEGGDPRV